LESRLSAPSAVRPGRDYGMTLTYANVGDADMAAPLFIVSAEDQQPSLYSLPRGLVSMARSSPGGAPSTPRVSQVQILGRNQEGPPGVLPPGASNEIPLYFQGDGGIWNMLGGVAADWHMAFNLSVLKADATPIHWGALEPRFRPDDMAADLWAAVWANFKSTVGATWADYLRALDMQAHALALGGESSYNAGDLLGAVFSQAIGTPYRRTLAAAVDAQAPVPTLPLQFSRFATDGLEHRFTAGPLGRGWSHSFEYALTQPATGGVVIRTPGGGARQFTPGSDGVWRGGTGDYATLTTTTNGGFVLVEKEGMAWQFDASGQLWGMEEPNGNRIVLEYSGGQLTGLTHSAGPSFRLEYNAQGRLVRLTDHTGQATSYEYDPSGEYLVRVVGPGGVATRYSYQPVTGGPADHALASVTFPDGTHQFFGWDGQGRLAEQSRDGGAERLRFTYDATGTVTMRDAQDAVTTLRLGSRGQLLQMTDALGRAVTCNYDTRFNLTRLTGPTGDTTELGYDAQGNASTIINPLAQTVTLGHAALGRLSTLQDARQQSTDFGYDPQGNLTRIAYPDASAELFGYDPSGSVTTWQNRRGQTIAFARNAQGQLTRKTYPDGRAIEYAYDARGLLTNVLDTAGAPTFVSARTGLAYDARGFLTGITYPDGKGFTFEYNAAGRRTRRVGHDGYTLEYGYDAAGRLESLRTGTGLELVRYSYDATGRLAREDKGNGTSTTYAYDLAGQILSLVNHAPDGSAESFFHYTYDAKGNRLSMTTAAGVTHYEYDALNQLTGVTYPEGRRVTYAYDPAGNRTRVADNGTNTVYTANTLNQYTTAGSAAFEYDLDGNLTRRTDETGTTTYEYDPENRLVRAATPAEGVWQYTYDALGNRTAVVHDGVTNRFLHDPIGLVDVAAEYDGGGALVARYDHALGLVARADAADGSAFYSFDALGNTRELTGTGGAVLNAYDYDVFGAATVANDTVVNSLQFSGETGVQGDSSSLYYLRARYYLASLGRFVTPDPAGIYGGWNLLTYVANNPVNLSDPTGLYLTFWQKISSPLRLIKRGNWLGKYNSGGRNDTSPGDIGNPRVLPVNDTWDAASKLHDILFYEGVPHAGGIAADWLANRVRQKIQAGEKISIGDQIWSGLFIISGYTGIIDIGLIEDPYGDGKEIVSTATASVVRPRDPNDKLGPAGIGPNRVVPVADEMEYTIRFENFATASAPVQELVVVDYLAADLDWTTVRFKEIAYGDRLVTPPAGSASFTVRDVPPAGSSSVTGVEAAQMVVEVRGAMNPQAGRLEWRVTCLDTNTGFWPMDALTGILPPEDGTGRGQGWVKFGVRPKSDAPIGTVITNVASIVFDSNEPIATPPVWNTLGDIPSLAATIAYPPAPISVGTPFTYTIALTNSGTAAVTNVVLTNTLPAGLEAFGVAASAGQALRSSNTVTWTVGELAPGAVATITVTAVPAAEGTFDLGVWFTGGSGLAIFESPGQLTAVASVRPALSIRVLAGEVELSWASTQPPYRVESAAAVEGPWLDSGLLPASDGQTTRLLLPFREEMQFFRLVRP
jgi:RHS repeat-associated protein/uncharacterized repeat protein (TIGR01451 family)